MTSLSIEVKVYKKWFETYLPEIESTFKVIKESKGIISDSTEEAVTENLDELISWLKKLLIEREHLDYDPKLIGTLEKIQKLGEEVINFVHNLDLREKILKVIRLSLITKSELEGDYQRKKKLYGSNFEKYLPSKIDKLEPEHFESLLHQAAKNVRKHPKKKESAALSRKDVAELLIRTYWAKKKLIGSVDNE